MSKEQSEEQSKEYSEDQSETHRVDGTDVSQSTDDAVDTDEADDANEYIDTQHVMTLLHVSKSTVCRMIQSGRLADARQDESKRWHVRRACVMEVLEQLRAKRVRYVKRVSKPRKQRAWYDIQPIIETIEIDGEGGGEGDTAH